MRAKDKADDIAQSQLPFSLIL